jgi:RNA recognition motif-containing protein
VFIKVIIPKTDPKYKDITSERLDLLFCQFGSVKSSKLSINADYSSRGYGFVCFNDQTDADRALKEAQIPDLEVKLF